MLKGVKKIFFSNSLCSVLNLHKLAKQLESLAHHIAFHTALTKLSEQVWILSLQLVGDLACKGLEKLA